MILGVLQSVVSKYMVYYKSKAGQIFSFSNKSCGVPVDLLAIKFVFELRLYKKSGKETLCSKSSNKQQGYIKSVKNF